MTKAKQMQVFSAIIGQNYHERECFELIGVFATREDALDCFEAKMHDGTFNHMHHIGIVESELGAELDMHCDIDWLDISQYRTNVECEE